MKKKKSPSSSPSLSLVHRRRASTELAVNPSVLDQAIKVFETALGGRAALANSLAIAPDVPADIASVLSQLADPRYDQYSLGELCRRHHVAPGVFFKTFRDASIAKASIIALTAVANALPGVTQELLTTAVTHQDTCDRCHGTKTITPPPTEKQPNPESTVCYRCSGTGSITIKGDLEAQKLALELAGLLKKSGLAIGIQNQIMPAAQPSQFGSLERLQQTVAGILSGTLPAAVEAEVIDG